MIIDAHTHLFSRELQRYPLADPQSSYRPTADGSVELLRRQMDEAGVDRAVTIPPAFCGWDARYALDALAQHGDWLAVAVLVDPLDPAGPQLLERYVHDYGVCGLRLQRRIPRPWEFEDEASTPLWAKAEELGITLDVNATQDEYPQVERRIRQFPRLRMVLDHCGYVSAELGPRSPTVEPVMRLARYPNVYAKLSFFGIANTEPYPFPALHWMARQLIEAFGAERCLYGSNFPTAQYNQKMSYTQTVQLFSEAMDLSHEERRWILGGTAERCGAGANHHGTDKMAEQSKTPVVDTHLHFWDLATYATASRSWLENNPAINRTFLPPDLKAHFDACGVDRGVIIEAARDAHQLNLWWLSLAEQYEYIGAVVVGCTLEQDNLAAWFDEYSTSRYFVGVRTSPVGPSASWWENLATQRGLQELARRDLSLDLLVGYETYPAVAQIAAHYPHLRIILDHCAHPPLREGKLDEWQQALTPLAAYPNIHIKYSSFFLYSYPDSAVERLRPLADFLRKNFGLDRIMWGSNWPVELLGGSYEAAFQIMQAGIEPLSEPEWAALFGGNAARFYRVQI